MGQLICWIFGHKVSDRLKDMDNFRMICFRCGEKVRMCIGPLMGSSPDECDECEECDYQGFELLHVRNN